MRERVLLVGNGINAQSPGYRWEDLILDLVKLVPKDEQINSNGKPFPLLYEEIVFRTSRRQLRENRIKGFIASKVKSIELNEIHKAIARSSLSTILTTNYDRTLEAAFGVTAGKLQNAGFFKEKRYNLFRVFNVGKTQIWHIHGESNIPSSIILGYEQYCGYLQYMRNYVVTGTGHSYKIHLGPLRKRIPKKKQLGVSWVDHFFVSDVYILGLTMDFVEIHLWWLLTYRARAKQSGLFPIRNKIGFFVPRPYVQNNKVELLRSCGVEVYPMKYNRSKRVEFYKEALRRIRNRDK